MISLQFHLRYKDIYRSNPMSHPQTTTNPGLFSGSEDYTHYPYPDEYMSSMQYLQQPQAV